MRCFGTKGHKTRGSGVRSFGIRDLKSNGHDGS